MSTKRSVAESPLTQGADEQIYYQFEWAAEGTPSSPAVTLYDLTSASDVTATKLTGSASVAGTKVTTPKVSGLAAGSQYRLACQVTVNGNKLSAFCIITGEA